MTMDATEQARMVRDREVSSVELIEQSIREIEALNPRVNAVIHLLFDEARAAAEDELPDGPFRGVPFLVKDGAATWRALRCTRGCAPCAMRGIARITICGLRGASGTRAS
jgi:amidase